MESFLAFEWAQVTRFLHTLFGITWIGLLYYFNFVGGGYVKDATPDAKKDYDPDTYLNTTF